MSATHSEHSEYIDHDSGKLGMWIFLFTELFLFGGLFLVYAIMRFKYSAEFHESSLHLDAFIGTLNTVVLLASSAAMAMSVTSIQEGKTKKTLWLIGSTIFAAAIFMVNKYFEWGHKFELQIYPGSEVLKTLSNGEYLYYSLYYLTTGLHALHVIIGAIFLTIVFRKVKKGKINKEHYLLLENGALYWHLVDLIWIFLFPLLYLIA